MIQNFIFPIIIFTGLKHKKSLFLNRQQYNMGRGGRSSGRSSSRSSGSPFSRPSKPASTPAVSKPAPKPVPKPAAAPAPAASSGPGFMGMAASVCNRLNKINH